MNKKIEIIVIEDEEDILELIEYHLSKEGFSPIGFLSTQNVEQFIEEESPSLMIVDRNLPGMEGSEFISYLRSIGYNIPVIFLTAKNSDSAIEEGFILGGDDYITKPFRPKELILRVKALLKRTGILTKQNILKYKKILISIENKKLYISDKEIILTHLEFDLLYIFMQNIDKPISRNYLRNEVWNNSLTVTNNSINVAINRLKHKIDPKNSENYFSPIWGIGYKFS